MKWGELVWSNVRWSSLRSKIQWWHRVVGLMMVPFLIVVGLTGSLLAFNEEIDAAINPELLRLSTKGDKHLSPLALREIVSIAYPHAHVDLLPLEIKDGQSIRFYLSAKPDQETGVEPELDHDQVFVDPSNGRILGARKWGAISQGFVNFMPFVYRLHYSLALGDFGYYWLGVLALLWTIDCLLALLLTFPSFHIAGSRWWRNWTKSWKIRWNAGQYKRNFDLHRAGSLWTWAILLVFAWSAVSFNLTMVYMPVMDAIFQRQKHILEVPMLEKEQYAPQLSFQAALILGERYMQEQTEQHQIRVGKPHSLTYDHHRAWFYYTVHSPHAIDDKRGGVTVYFDANTGAFQQYYQPSGKTKGDTLHAWLSGLHRAAIWGLPLQLFVCLIGLVLAVLSYTGFAIWWRRRKNPHELKVAVPQRQLESDAG